jgi:hypothetical protein
MLVKFEEKDKKVSTLKSIENLDIDEMSKVAGKVEAETIVEMEGEKINPTPEEIEVLENVLEEINRKKFSNLTEQEEPEEKKPNRLVYNSRND